jgi:hypothetical protein
MRVIRGMFVRHRCVDPVVHWIVLRGVVYCRTNYPVGGHLPCIASHSSSVPMRVDWVGEPCWTWPLNLRETVAVSRADYAAQWQRTARTRDGIDYRIRPIRIEDAERDRAFIIHLSEASRYKRLMGSVREPSQELIDRFVRIDYQHDMAFVAVVDQLGAERIIGVARYAAVSD